MANSSKKLSLEEMTTLAKKVKVEDWSFDNKDFDSYYIGKIADFVITFKGSKLMNGQRYLLYVNYKNVQLGKEIVNEELYDFFHSKRREILKFYEVEGLDKARDLLKE